jgi:flagellar motor switch protein FliN/FliY
MTAAETALVKLGESSGDAIVSVLEMLVGVPVERGAPLTHVVDHPLEKAPTPAVAVSVSYIDGIKGGNVFLLTRRGARRIAGAMMGAVPEDDDAEVELSELELSAVGEAMNQMIAAAAGATSRVLGYEVEIGTPQTHFFATPAEAMDAFEKPPYAVSVSFAVLGEHARLVQLVPAAFVVRMEKAYEQLSGELVDNSSIGPTFSEESIRSIPVRVWAELGRTRLTLANAVGLPPGTVVGLDRGADDPVDLYVNGHVFGRGRLTLVDEEWAVEVEEILPRPATETMNEGGTQQWHAFSS